jgi:tetratricopeptide (TPR) repeat protein
LLALLVLSGLSACASLPDDVRQYGEGVSSVELSDAPFYPQERYQCGPAALMTVLTYSGADTTLEALVDQVYLPGRHGSLQTELVAATRASGRVPYQIDSALSAIAAELQAGRPVLVLQNLGVGWLPRWHYAVVIGVDAIHDTVTLRSGTQRRHVTAADTFLRTWKRGDYWGLVVLRPGDLPANPDASRYFRAVAALESIGQLEEAHAAWRAALDRWPGQTIALFGLANTEFALDNYSAAEKLYRQILITNPHQLSARNNLAHALARQGKNSEAMQQLHLALDSVDGDPAMQGELQDSLAEIRAQRLSEIE